MKPESRAEVSIDPKEKLIKRLQARPKDFTFEELITLLAQFGYTLEGGGKTGGSRIRFATEDGAYIRLHKPHPRNILKEYQLDEILDMLKERGLL